MRLPAGIDPEKLPVLAALAAAAAFTLLLAGAVAVYAAVDAVGGVLLAFFLAASLGLAASGWVMHWRARRTPARPQPWVERRSPLRNAGQDSPAHRLLEAVAVEIKSTAGTLTGFAEVLAPEADAATGSHMLEASRNLLAFAAQLHDYVRFERGRLRLSEQQVDAGELLEAALASCRAPAEANGTAIEGHTLEGVELACDALRLREAIASLVLWAVQSSAAGGVVDVRLIRLPDDGLAIDIASSSAATGKLLRDRLFEPQLSVAGLQGLALPIARRVALLHAGEVTASASPGDGTATRLTLPAARVVWPGAHRPARAA